MRKLHTPGSVRAFLRQASRPLVLVPTMGALHAGHATLLQKGRALAKSGSLVASIFVNPTQFGPKEDYRRYPRTLAADCERCAAAGVDAVFLPQPAAMYAPDHSVFVIEQGLARGFCGAARPGHFQGVCTVVAKLFLLFRPEIAVFGEKDWQQLAVVRRMVRDLNFGVKVVGCPTVRESDGLAMSSRNRLLSRRQRQVAPEIYAGLRAVRPALAGGEIRAGELRQMLAGHLAKIPGAVLDYAEIVDADTLQPVRAITRRAVALVAVRLGRVRLIDNILLQPPRERI